MRNRVAVLNLGQGEDRRWLVLHAEGGRGVGERLRGLQGRFQYQEIVTNLEKNAWPLHGDLVWMIWIRTPRSRGRNAFEIFSNSSGNWSFRGLLITFFKTEMRFIPKYRMRER